VPATIKKSTQDVFAQTSVLEIKGYDANNPHALAGEELTIDHLGDEQINYTTIPQVEKAIKMLKKQMDQAAKELDFMEAARIRDEMFRLQAQLTEMKK
jgi:excinuclease ABC subunit B